MATNIRNARADRQRTTEEVEAKILKVLRPCAVYGCPITMRVAIQRTHACGATIRRVLTKHSLGHAIDEFPTTGVT